MASGLQDLLKLLAQPAANQTLTGLLHGLEKESLRITPQGTLAQTDHPKTLGSALKHPHITTDYSEALLEFITDPFPRIDQLLEQLDDIHRFSYAQLASLDERLWPASMPCRLEGDERIPLARYGNSNAGLMKTIYRRGLGYRYGRAMQTIAGIHYNFSLPDSLWEILRAEEGSRELLQNYKTRRYFDLIRNFRRYFWLLIYLFGASPAVCGSFVKGREHRLQPLDPEGYTLYLPYATSLRMGDLGYQSSAQEALLVDYNQLTSYLQTLCGAITRSHPAYADIGLLDEQGQYRQLNTSLLQIENEFYSSIRPKRPARSGETALQALRLGGVEYIEVRCVDLNPYEPLGVTPTQLRVMDAFLLLCLMEPSPETDAEEYRQIQENQKRIVYEGRKPGLTLRHKGEEVAMSSWAQSLLEQMQKCAQLLDQAWGGEEFQTAVAEQMAKLSDPALTPSARVLADLRANNQSFFRHTLELAEAHRTYFAARALGDERRAWFEQLAQTSIQAQAEQEAEAQQAFADYLASYYAQYESCRGCC